MLDTVSMLYTVSSSEKVNKHISQNAASFLFIFWGTWSVHYVALKLILCKLFIFLLWCLQGHLLTSFPFVCWERIKINPNPKDNIGVLVFFRWGRWCFQTSGGSSVGGKKVFMPEISHSHLASSQQSSLSLKKQVWVSIWRTKSIMVNLTQRLIDLKNNPIAAIHYEKWFQDAWRRFDLIVRKAWLKNFHCVITAPLDGQQLFFQYKKQIYWHINSHIQGTLVFGGIVVYSS